MRSVMKFIGSMVGFVLVAGMIFGMLMDAGIVPSERVLAGSDIPADQIEVLLTEGIVNEGEVIEYFYSEGLISVREGGSILTDQRIIAYEENENDELDIFEIRNEDVVSVELVQQGDTLNYSIYTVSTGNDDEWVDLWLPHENGDAERFVAAVKSNMSQ